MNWYLAVLKKYAVFNGRASRSEFWFFVLINFIIAFVIGFIEGLIGLSSEYGYGPISGLYTLAILLPAIGVAIRRLHDSGRTGFWLLVGFIPFIGALILIVLYVLDSEPGANQYGEPVKGLPPSSV